MDGKVIESKSECAKDCMGVNMDGWAVGATRQYMMSVGGTDVLGLCRKGPGTMKALVFQQRRSNGTSFLHPLRNWKSYTNIGGFGNDINFWRPGLEGLHRITTVKGKTCQLIVELEDMNGKKCNAKYSNFSIGNASSKYMLNFDKYMTDSTCGDSLTATSKGRPFSTADSDNDLWVKNCAAEYSGAWWYSKCHDANLNGLYLGGAHPTVYGKGVGWKSCGKNCVLNTAGVPDGLFYSFKSVMMAYCYDDVTK